MPSLRHLPPEAWEPAEPPFSALLRRSLSLLAGRSLSSLARSRSLSGFDPTRLSALAGRRSLSGFNPTRLSGFDHRRLAGFAGGQSSWDRIRSMAAKGQEFYRARDAYLAGDEQPMLGWVVRKLGREPDEMLRRILDEHYLRDEEWTTFFVYRLLAHHEMRLEVGSASWYGDGLGELGELTRKVYDSLAKHDGHELMRALEHYGDSRGERLKGLRRELPAAVFEVECAGFFDAETPYVEDGVEKPWMTLLLPEVQRIIKNSNRPIRQMLSGISALDARDDGVRRGEDHREIAEWAEMEHERERLARLRRVREAAAPRQREVFELRRKGHSYSEIAAALGIEEGTVGAHLNALRARIQSA